MVNTTLRPLYLRERPGTPCIGGWVGPRACLDGCGKSRPPPGFDTRTVQSLASRCTDCVITAHVQNKDMINKFSTVRVMMAYREGRSTALSTFTISDGCRRSSSCSGHFTPGEITTSTNQVWSCGLRSRLVLLEKGRILCPAGTEPNSLGRWASSPGTKHAIPAPQKRYTSPERSRIQFTQRLPVFIPNRFKVDTTNHAVFT